MKAPIIATADEYTIGEDVILVDPATGLPRATWVHGAVKNKIDIEYDWNTALARDKFARRQIWTASKSADSFGVQLGIRMSLRGVKTDNGGQALMDELALGFMQRWGVAPWFLRCQVCFLRHTLEVLDGVRVTHRLLANPLTGKLGIDREQFEVLEAAYSLGVEGRIDLLMLWLGGIEVSAVPLSSGAFSMIPGLSTVDGADASIPVGTSITLTTATATKSIRVGFKRNAWRRWNCRYEPSGEDVKGGPCIVGPPVFKQRSYSGQNFYKVEYKTTAAPDVPGSGGDPTTGWIVLLDTSRGGVALLQSKDCTDENNALSVNGEDVFSHFFETLGASPNTYNVKLHYLSVSQQADPCPVSGLDCSAGACTDVFLDSALHSQDHYLTKDFLESIT